MVWYSYLLKNFPQFVVIHIVKGFSRANEAPVLWHCPSLGLEWKLTFLLLFNITFIIVLFNITFIKVAYAKVLFLTVPTSQVALVVKNTPASSGAIRDGLDPWIMKTPLDEGMANHFSILAWRILWIEEPGSYSPWSHKELDRTDMTQNAGKLREGGKGPYLLLSQSTDEYKLEVETDIFSDMTIFSFKGCHNRSLNPPIFI